MIDGPLYIRCVLRTYGVLTYELTILASRRRNEYYRDSMKTFQSRPITRANFGTNIATERFHENLLQKRL